MFPCRPFERLFTRMGTSDSIETNASSFMVEMQVWGEELEGCEGERCFKARLQMRGRMGGQGQGWRGGRKGEWGLGRRGIWIEDQETGS